MSALVRIILKGDKIMNFYSKNIRTGKTENNGSRGFTLMEIMIAIAVLGMGLTLMATIFRHNIKINNKGDDILTASLLGQKKMEEMVQSGYSSVLRQSANSNAPIEFRENGEIVSPKYRWELKVAQEQKDLIKMDVRVVWPWPENGRHVEFSTFLANR